MTPSSRRLRDSLRAAEWRTAAIAGTAVHGMGGVGKTRAAVEYAWAHRGDYTALFAGRGETPDKLHSRPLPRWSARCACPSGRQPDEAARLEAALAWLNANPGWLLILDNIDAEPALAAAHGCLGPAAPAGMCC